MEAVIEFTELLGLEIPESIFRIIKGWPRLIK
jgi:hypothetical protein